MKMKLALIGCGAIGSTLAKAVRDKVINASLEIVYDSNRGNAQRACKIFKKKPVIAEGITDILESDANLVIEAASQTAVNEFALGILKAQKSLMVLSVGAFADKNFFEKVKNAAMENGAKVYVPSGAIGGLDAVKSAAIANIDEVNLITTKNPKSLGIQTKERKVIYEGNAAEAVKKFPANINVSMTLSLAAIGAEKTKVKIVADPSVDKNIHKIYAKGNFGEFKFRIENVPFAENPKTSYLAALSAIALLKRITSPVEVGT